MFFSNTNHTNLTNLASVRHLLYQGEDIGVLAGQGGFKTDCEGVRASVRGESLPSH